MIPIKILNVTENDILIPEINPTIYKVNENDLCTFDRNSKNADRMKKVFVKLRLEHLNEETDY